MVASNDGADKLLLTANAGLDGNNIPSARMPPMARSSSTPSLPGPGPLSFDISSAQVGAGFDTSCQWLSLPSGLPPQATAPRETPRRAPSNAVGATDAVLVTSSATYVPPTSLTDKFYINGVPLTVLLAGGTGTVGEVNYETSATITSDHIRTAIQAIPWLNNLLVVGGTSTVTFTSRYRDTVPTTPVAGLGPWGNYVTMYSAGLTRGLDVGACQT